MSAHRILRLTPSSSWLRRSARAVLPLLSAVVLGCQETPTETANQAPTAGFTQSCTALSCAFDATASADADGSIASYAWDFGDGGSDTGSTPAHTFAASGTFTVALTVTDDDGAVGTTTSAVSVAAANQSPTAAFTSSCTDLDCTFDASTSSDADGSIASYSWAFGDGASDSGEMVTHSFAGAGTYDVSLTVADDLGATHTDTQSTTVTVPFAQLGGFIPGLSANEQFGRSSAMSDDGSRILASAPYSSAGASLSGQVRAFEWDGADWAQLGQSIDGFESSLLLGDDKGITMSGDGQRIALGTPRSGPGSRGSVIAYELSGDSWVQMGTEIIPLATSQFGTAVSMSTDGSRLAVGGPLSGGRLEVYEFTGGDWVQMGASVLGTDPDRVGYDVSLSGDGTRVLASVQGATVDGVSGAGTMRVYDWNGSAWAQVGGDIDGRGGFGLNASMSRDGRRVVGYAASTGDYAAVFELVGSAWVQMGADFAVPGAFDVHQNVDLSASGDRVVIGSMFSGPDNQGIVNIYDWSGGAWTEVGTGIVGPHQSSDLGWSVSISADGDRLMTGLPGYEASDPANPPGGVAVYDVISR